MSTSPQANTKKMTTTPTIGAMLRARREELGLTQQEVADRAGVSKRSYEDYENDRYDVPRRRMRAISGVLRMTQEEAGDTIRLEPNDALVAEYSIEDGAVSRVDVTRVPGPKGALYVMCEDESMEPTLRKGSYVAVRPVDEGERHRDGIFLVVIEERILFRSLQFLPDGVVRVSCDNPRFQDYEIRRERSGSLVVLGHVL